MGELNKLYENRADVGNMGTSYYWSSSQGSNYSFDAWYLNFYNGNRFDYYYVKGTKYSVRAVRAF